MTKKHFIYVAKLIAVAPDDQYRKFLAINFAILFKKLNKRFDSDRFFNACKVE